MPSGRYLLLICYELSPDKNRRLFFCFSFCYKILLFFEKAIELGEKMHEGVANFNCKNNV